MFDRIKTGNFMEHRDMKFQREQKEMNSFKEKFSTWYGGEVNGKSEKEAIDLISKFSKETKTEIPEQLKKDIYVIENPPFEVFREEHPSLKYESYIIYKTWMKNNYPNIRIMTRTDFKNRLNKS